MRGGRAERGARRQPDGLAKSVSGYRTRPGPTGSGSRSGSGSAVLSRHDCVSVRQYQRTIQMMYARMSTATTAAITSTIAAYAAGYRCQ